MVESNIVSGKSIELLIKCKIVQFLPKDVLEILNHLFVKRIPEHRFKEKVKRLPRHNFFKCHNWKSIGNTYLPINSLSHFDRKNLFTICSFNNYENEIDLFLDWLNPYIDEKKGHFIGWKWCEGYSFPKFIYKKKIKKKYINYTLTNRCEECNAMYQETLKKFQRRKKANLCPTCPVCFKKIKCISKEFEENMHQIHHITTATIMRKYKITFKAAKEWIDHYNTLNNLTHEHKNVLIA